MRRVACFFFLAWWSFAASADGVLPPGPVILCAPYVRISISYWGVDLAYPGGSPLVPLGSWAQYATGPSGGSFNTDPVSSGEFRPWFMQSWDGVALARGASCPPGTQYVSMPVNDYEALIMTTAIVTELQTGWNMAAIGLAALCLLIGFFMGYKMMQRGGSQ